MQNPIIEGFELSRQQKYLWLSQKNSLAYPAHLTILIEGSLKVEALKDAFQKLVNQHEIIRTTFQMIPEMEFPIQIVNENASPKWQELDLRNWSFEQQEVKIEKLLREERQVYFNFNQSSLLRLTLITLSAHQYILLLTLPSLCADARSLNNLIQEISSLYSGSQQNNLPEQVSIQYAYFSAWQNELLVAEDSEVGREYWQRNKIIDYLNLRLPLEGHKTKDLKFQPQVLAFSLDLDLLEKIAVFVQKQKTSISVFFLTCWQILLWRLTGQSDIIIGTICDGRSYQELVEGLGLFAKYLPIHCHIEEDDCFIKILQQTNAATHETYSWQEYFAWEQIIGTRENADTQHPSLFCFDFEEGKTKYVAHDVSFTIKKQYNCFAPFKAKLSCINKGDVFDIEFHYNSFLFSVETIERLASQFNTLLKNIVSNFNTSLSKLQIISVAEQQKLLIEWNNTKADYRREQCLHQLFEAQVAQTPEAIAIVFEDQQISYQELNQRANELAHYLQKQGVGTEVLVGLCVERSLEMVIGILGILKAGGAYVPLDPAYPQERLAFMLSDAQVSILLTQQRLVARLPKHVHQLVDVDNRWLTIATESTENLSTTFTAQHLAYVIYTSGSTGIPKGVAIAHQNTVAFVDWALKLFTPKVLAGVLASTSICFDLSVFELFVPLSCGGKVILVDNVLNLPVTAASQHVTLINTVPAAMAELLHINGVPACVSTVCLAGETLSNEIAQHIYQQDTIQQVFNLYGPSEDTTYSTFTLVNKNAISSPTIGRPIANTQIYILNCDQEPVPIGVAGELYISSAGLARGYLNRLELTADKFIPNPFSHSPGTRMYKTGDLACYLPDGNIQFLGRSDRQVKIRGFRIELAGIEAVLNQHPAVSNAIFQAQEDEAGNKRLIAYVVSNQESSPTTGELRRFLQQKLPNYMIPSVFVFLKALPLTLNGKIDYRRLPAPEQIHPELEISFVAPRTVAEQIVADIWIQVLNLQQVGIHDNFFDLGGHSLLAIQVTSRLNKAFQVELSVRSLFEAPTVFALVEAIAKIGNGQKIQGINIEETQTHIIPRITGTEPCQISLAQERLWFLNQLEADGAYNISSAICLKGLLNTTALQQSLNEIVCRHEVFRTSFVLKDNQPVQIVAPSFTLTFRVIDLMNLSEIEQGEEVQRLATSDAQLPFNLAQVPLLRATLLQLSEADHVLLFTTHHIVFDGWSIGILIRELAVLYEAFSDSLPSPLSELPIQYVDFAVWQRQWLQDEVLKAQLTYWQRQLVGSPALQLPTDYPRPAIQTFRGATESFSLSKKLTEGLKVLSRLEGVTLFMTLLAAFKTCLYRYSGQDDIVVGSPIANRHRTELEGLIGFFVNTLVLRTDLSGNPSFLELLHRLQEVTLDAYTHQDLPFAYLVEKLQPERSLSHNPIFQVMFAFQNVPTEELKLHDLSLSFLSFDRQTATFDLNLSMQDGESGLQGEFQYNTDLFNADTIRRMLEHFCILLAGIITNPDQRLSNLPFLKVTEQHQLLVEWNNTQTDYPHDLCIHQLFEAQLSRSPDAIATIYEGEQLTYQQLNQQANQLADHLQKLGVKPEGLVGICIERSPLMLVGLLGILKAGGAYVPLDPEYPLERLTFILCDSQVPILLTQEKLVAKLSEHQALLVCLDTKRHIFDSKNTENISSSVQPENLAYVIYTSGSTGKPKGTMITHLGLVNYLHWCTKAYAVADGCGAPVHSSLGFDATITSLFSPLLMGRSVVFIPSKQEIEVLSTVLDSQNDFSLVKITPAHLEMLSQLLSVKKIATQVKALVIGGDSLLANHISFWRTYMPNTRIFNEYGPTETVVGCCVYEVPPQTDIANFIPIGRAIANTHLYILDSHLQPVPIGTPGELYIGGIGLARGYLNHPQLTAEKFIPNPFEKVEEQGSRESVLELITTNSSISTVKPGSRLYKTGDLARYLIDGNIEYLGRLDRQVKIRGFRIELGEIEAALNRHPNIQQTVVIDREDHPGNKRLVAYIVPRLETIPTVSNLRDFLTEKLPKYMMPSAFVVLEALPLTANGKIDYQQLPQPDDLPPELATAYVAPQTQTEKMLATIWQVVLNVEKVGIYDNFFDLGGHSLLVVQVYSQVREIFPQDISIVDLFTYPTISSFAQYLNQGDTLESERESLQTVRKHPASRREALKQQRQRRKLGDIK